jgi:lysozyme
MPNHQFLVEWAFDPALKGFMERVEGRRDTAYKDSLGITTIGIGRNIGTRPLSHDEIDMLYANDVTACEAQMDHSIPWWRQLPSDCQRAMVSLCFMGWGAFSQFHQFLAAMEQKDWPRAHLELRNSKWWGQVGQRGPLTLALIHDETTPGPDADA